MINNKKTPRDLQTQWDLAVESAAATNQQPIEVEDTKLRDVVGLSLASHLRAGLGGRFGTSFGTISDCPTRGQC